MTQKLGLTTSPETVTYIFVGEADSDEGNAAWYKWDHDANKQIPIKEDALVGYVTNIVINKKTFKNQSSYKINIHVNADHKYVIRAGVGTTFSRGFVLSLKKLIDLNGPDALKSPITLSVKLGESSEKVVFCGVFGPTGEKVIPDWDSEATLAPIINSIQFQLGQVVQTKEMMDDSVLYYQAVVAHREAPVEEEKPKRGGKKNGQAKP